MSESKWGVGGNLYFRRTQRARAVPPTPHLRGTPFRFPPAACQSRHKTLGRELGRKVGNGKLEIQLVLHLLIRLLQWKSYKRDVVRWYHGIPVCLVEVFILFHKKISSRSSWRV